MRVIGYIDGMNFYEASKNKLWYPAGWCDWTQTLAMYSPGASVSVKYFTTLYTGRDQTRIRRQKLHLLAMKEVARAEIIFGSCRERPIQCPNCRSELSCPRCQSCKRFVEKMTDVNIAVRLLEDAVDAAFDRAYVVSADVDLIPAVHAALRRAPRAQVVVLIPPEAIVAEEFGNLSQEYPGRSEARFLDLHRMKRFPDDLPWRWGMRLPVHWRENAGKRPARPDAETNLGQSGRLTPWFEESTGFGTQALSSRPVKRR
jgi:hypothetical protein